VHVEGVHVELRDVVPTEASTRPQLGSSPNTAHLNRLLRATERATSTASSSVAAPTTSIAMSCAEPSASRSSWPARSAHTCRTASSKAASSGAVPLAPDAMSSTVSLVDWQPSESSRSNVVRVAARRARSQPAASTSASVVSTTSIVASAGASMPAPLAMPPTVKPGPVATACLRTESVVMMAVAASGPPSASRAACASSTPCSIRSRENSGPIRPVEQTTTEPAPSSSSAATRSAVACVVWKPSAPVPQLAPAGVEDDGADVAAAHDLLAPQHRVGLEAVAREDGCTRPGPARR
jgi:hypothetical protein